MAVDLFNVEPLYRQLYKNLRDDIAGGHYEPSKRLPTEPELSRKYKVSVTTVRQAVSLLVSERLVYRRQGRGTFIASPRDAHVFKKVKAIGFLADYPKDNLDGRFEVLPHIIHEIEDEGSENGYNLSIFNTQNDPARARERIKSISNGDLDGIVFWPSVNGSDDEMNHGIIDALAAMKIPVVLFDRQVHGYHLDHVTSDNKLGVYQLIEHFIASGHRRIAVISDPESSTIRDRLAGYKKALRDAKIEIDPQLIKINHRQGDMSEAVGQVKSLLELDDRPTAIFATYDNLAQTVMNTLKDNGLSVPGDMAVAGYDNRQFAEAISLTTVDQHFGKMARAAVKRLTEKIEGKDDEIKEIVVKSELIIRESSQKLSTKTNGNDLSTNYTKNTKKANDKRHNGKTTNELHERD